MKKITTYLLLLSSLAVTSCYKEVSNAYGWEYQYTKESNLTDLNPKKGYFGEREDFKEKSEQKVIYTAFLTMTVKELDTVNAAIKNIAKRYNGYVSESGTKRAIIRVESKYLTNAVSEIERLGTTERKSIKGQDVTDDYFDLNLRLDNAQKARIRYLELLANAENVTAALKVEKELERLNGTIETLKGQISNINHLDQFSTLTINLNQKKKPGILGYIGIGIYKSVKWLFIRG